MKIKMNLSIKFWILVIIIIIKLINKKIHSLNIMINHNSKIIKINFSMILKCKLQSILKILNLNKITYRLDTELMRKSTNISTTFQIKNQSSWIKMNSFPIFRSLIWISSNNILPKDELILKLLNIKFLTYLPF